MPCAYVCQLVSSVCYWFTNRSQLASTCRPKIISKDGNLIFESGANRNISFRLSGSSRLLINEEYDVLELLMPISGNKKRPTGSAKDEWSGADDIVDLRDLADQLTEFRAQALGPNGLNTMFRQIQNRFA